MTPDPDHLQALYAIFLRSGGVSTDTRTLQPGQVFFALRGPRYDANTFIEPALAAGASAVVYDSAAISPAADARLHLVDDALVTLQQLAAHHRTQLGLPVLGLTGSNGKTTTKELLRSILGQQLQVFATPGNLNNHIGLPLSLLRLTAAHQFAILEMGDNKPGDIAELCQIAQPTLGLITNLGEDHLAGYGGSMAGNAATKHELFDYCRAQGGHIFLNEADPWLAPYPAPAGRTTRYNTEASGYTISLVSQTLAGMTFNLQSPVSGATTYTTPLYGAYNLQNILAAVVVAEHLGLTPAQIQAGLAGYSGAANRSEVVVRGSKTFILDAYNANPSSMQQALDNVFELAGSHRIGLILGDMLELGDQSPEAHEALGLALALHPSVPTLLVGIECLRAYRQIPYEAAYWQPRTDDALPLVADLFKDCDLILLKGSRGMALERLVEGFPG